MQIWSQASQMAAQTPAERNRYVDFLRFVSIMAVIIGHWLIATAYVVNGDIDVGHLLKGRPQLHWLTWIFQVMPIFFIVGGYSNAVSLESSERKGIGYAGWLSARLNRLVAPLLILVVAWAVIAIVMTMLGAEPRRSSTCRRPLSSQPGSCRFTSSSSSSRRLPTRFGKSTVSRPS